jgi:hypothetical protein
MTESAGAARIGGGDFFLAPHGVKGDHGSPQVQGFDQVRDGGDFVGLMRGLELAQHQAQFRNPGADRVKGEKAAWCNLLKSNSFQVVTKKARKGLKLFNHFKSASCKSGSFCHPERSEGSQPCKNTRFFAVLRMTTSHNTEFYKRLSREPVAKCSRGLQPAFAPAGKPVPPGG